MTCDTGSIEIEGCIGKFSCKDGLYFVKSLNEFKNDFIEWKLSGPE